MFLLFPNVSSDVLIQLEIETAATFCFLGVRNFTGSFFVVYLISLCSEMMFSVLIVKYIYILSVQPAGGVLCLQTLRAAVI